MADTLLFFFGNCDFCGEAFKEVLNQVMARFSRSPYIGDIGNPFRIAANSRVSNFKLAIPRAEGYFDVTLLVVRIEHFFPAKYGIKGREPLLAVDDKPGGNLVLFIVDTYLLNSVLGTIFPEEEISNRKAAIHGVKQVTDLCIGPYKGTLNIRKSDVADINIMQKAAQIVVNFLKASFSSFMISFLENILR